MPTGTRNIQMYISDDMKGNNMETDDYGLRNALRALAILNQASDDAERLREQERESRIRANAWRNRYAHLLGGDE